MPDSKANIWKVSLLLPLTVAMIAGILSFILPRWFSTDVELSYILDGPISPEGSDYFKELEFTIFQVKLWNSGDTPLEDIPVSVVFDAADSSFRVLDVHHQTEPAFEFGQIQDSSEGDGHLRFLYDLLNPEDRDEISILIAGRKVSSPSVFAKAKGLKVTHVQPAADSKSSLKEIFPVIAALVAGIASAVTIFAATAHPKEFVSRIIRFFVQK